jgi:tRNA 2-selenouridine synthase
MAFLCSIFDCCMAIENIHIEQFLQLAKCCPVLDVRSPGEYKHAHIPGAFNLPLFTDEERKVVGTAYKQQSREIAIKTGLDYFGPKMRKMVEEAEELSKICDTKYREQHNAGANHASGVVLLHCWRGGMRSSGVAWLLDLYGFKVYTLTGGYKKFRQYVLESFSLPYQFKIVGGYTGSGKTELLHELEKQNELIIDLEKLASHKGSAFGSLGMPPQPTQEMFENLLATALQNKLTDKEIINCVWLEDESQRIGDINLPQGLWLTMRKAPVYFINIPFEERLQHIVTCYGKQDKEKMLDAIIRIKKRLGGLETKTAVNYLVEDNITECFRVLLKYYDKWYSKGLQSRELINELLIKIDCNKVSPSDNAQTVLTSGKLVLK